MRAALARRLPASPGGRAALVGLAAAGVLLLASRAPGDLGPQAARAGLAACAVGALAVLARRRPGAARAAPPPLVVVARAPLSREAGVALVEVDGRRLLVGFGADRVTLLDGPPPVAGREVRP